MSTSTLANLSLAALREAVEIKEQINKLQARLAALLGSSPATAVVAKAAKSGKGHSKMSQAARDRIGAAQRLRWAKQKGAAKAAAPASAAKSKGTAKPKRNLSAAARKKLSDMMKARWAARKNKK